MKITVVFSDRTDGAVGSKLIKWFEKTDFSHVSVLFEDSYIYEAVYPRYHKIMISDWLKYNKIIKMYSFDVDFKDYVEAHYVATKLIGKVYSVSQLALIFLENSFKKTIKPISDVLGAIKLNNNRQLICTESVILILKQIGLKYDGSNDTISLNDFDSIVSKFKQEKKYE